MSFENLQLTRQDSILTVTIARAAKMNALNQKTLAEIRSVMEQVYADKAVKAVIFIGEGEKAFIAGADISEFTAMNEINARKLSESGQEIFMMIETCPKPVIAAVNGFALGGGCELAMACHLRIASENARFGLPEVTLGLLPGYGGTQRLPQLVGKAKALEMMLTAEMITATEAKTLGLVNHLVPTPADLLPKAKELLAKILKNAPIALEMVINCVNAAYNQSEEDGYQTEANSFGICARTEDFTEGTMAFLEKRKANFHGK
ncbi:MAG: enoyl-CoA hydratase/isomerase family protein [Verrucomicrobia bacterium]|nr:enoyl-CoA hydratase/isomerase family protein [Cytophagales bacterium]